MLEICSTSLLQCRHHRRSPQSHRHSTRSRSIDERHRRRRDSSRGRSPRSRSREHRYCSTERRDLICSGLHRVRSCSTGHKWVGQTAQRFLDAISWLPSRLVQVAIWQTASTNHSAGVALQIRNVAALGICGQSFAARLRASYSRGCTNLVHVQASASLHLGNRLWPRS